MKKKISLIAFSLIMILSIFSGSIFADTYPEHTSNFYLDQLDVLKEDTKEHINSVNKELEEKTKAQIVVVTIKNLDGKSAEEYGLNLGRKWEVGDKDENNGIVIIVGYEPSTKKYSTAIQVGYGLEGAINDAKAGRIIDDYLVKNYDKNDIKTLNLALNETFNAVVSQVANEYGVSIEGDYSKYDEELYNDEGSVGDIFILLVIILIIIISFSNKNNRRPPNNRRRKNYDDFFGGGFFGGGFGGGSSGGGFSGGGGSFGGGGAGRGL
ncbi:TPM domain-containing protein [Peptostreptococcus faecalis]|uniref:TPM domain-containing protein n=1 Tax=Peptostreptococcus faecalis TaxID=2045015 RepID=UPI000C7E3D28|nr:TPM domain-containing protein [Peptostreptococcus faecalis]